MKARKGSHPSKGKKEEEEEHEIGRPHPSLYSRSLNFFLSDFFLRMEEVEVFGWRDTGAAVGTQDDCGQFEKHASPPPDQATNSSSSSCGCGCGGGSLG